MCLPPLPVWMTCCHLSANGMHTRMLQTSAGVALATWLCLSTLVPRRMAIDDMHDYIYKTPAELAAESGLSLEEHRAVQVGFAGLKGQADRCYTYQGIACMLLYSSIVLLKHRRRSLALRRQAGVQVARVGHKYTAVDVPGRRVYQAAPAWPPHHRRLRQMVLLLLSPVPRAKLQAARIPRNRGKNI